MIAASHGGQREQREADCSRAVYGCPDLERVNNLALDAANAVAGRSLRTGSLMSCMQRGLERHGPGILRPADVLGRRGSQAERVNPESRARR